MNTATMTMQAPRRLIGARELAQKIGHGYTWVIKNWEKMASEKGFPRPVLGGGVGSHLRWDERAIDLWLDGLMPEALQKVAGTDFKQDNNKPAETASEIEARLKNRAKELKL